MARRRLPEIISRKVDEARVRGIDFASQTSLNFFRRAAGELRNVSRSDFFVKSTPQGVVNPKFHVRPQLGNMYVYWYDPKHKRDKKKLPYYDRFPLIFIIDKIPGGDFLGINFHYVYPKTRIEFFTKLFPFLTDRDFDDRTKMNINYSVLKRFKQIKPMIKRYKPSQLRSVMRVIHPSEWEMVLFLPVAKFVRASDRQVWGKSNRKMNR